MNGLIGILFAFALSTKCTATGTEGKAIVLKCDDAQKSELLIPLTEWPKEWHGPQIGWVYHLDEKGQPLSSFAEFAVQQEIRHKQILEGKRWRRHALQANDPDVNPVAPKRDQ